ncbi:retrovirus-related pol polyprotein from transposon TNT 1-94 [Tanacetum coccineum]
MDLCGPMRVESFNGKKYVLVNVDDYSIYTWTHFLRSKDETPEVLIESLKLVQRGLHAQVRIVRTDKGYSTQSRAYKVYNKRTRVIVKTIHVNFDEWPLMALDHVSSDPDPQLTTSNELDLLFSPMFDELLNGTTPVVSKSSAVHAADAPDQRQQHNTTPSTSTTVAAYTPPLNIQTTPVTTSQSPTQAPTVTATENINQAETHEENAQVNEDEFINIFSTREHEQRETSSRYVDSSNKYTFYQRDPFEHRWTRDHLLEQVIGNPSQSIRIRRQTETDGEMCMFALTVSQTEPKNIKEAMADSAWIEAMQEELHQFDRLDVWELVDRPLSKIYDQQEGIDFKGLFAPALDWKLSDYLLLAKIQHARFKRFNHRLQVQEMKLAVDCFNEELVNRKWKHIMVFMAQIPGSLTCIMQVLPDTPLEQNVADERGCAC